MVDTTAEHSDNGSSACEHRSTCNRENPESDEQQQHHHPPAASVLVDQQESQELPCNRKAARLQR